MPRHPSLTRLLALAGSLGCALTACAPGAYDVSVPTPGSAAADTACTALHDALPPQLGGHGSRDTAPPSDLTAAWGRPAITLRCGVPRPADLSATSQLLRVDGVDWFPEALTAGYRFTTVGRVADVEVDVPDDYAPEAALLTGLAAPVRENLPPLPTR